MNVDCQKCQNRGKVNGLSEDTYCSSCIHATPWKKDHYQPCKGFHPDEYIHSLNADTR